MPLTLLAIALNDQPLSQPITACFDASGGTIGRADHNTMALPDPERHISRLQAEVVSRDTTFMIRNVGAANPISVAGRTVNRGETAMLEHGDEVRIGGYLLKVDCRDLETTQDITRGRALHTLTPQPSTPPPAPRAPALSSANPFADLLGNVPPPPGGPVSDPFADLLPPPAGVTPGSAAVAPAAPLPPRLPDDFDLFAAPLPPAPAPAPTDPFADLVPAGPAPDIDRAFGLDGGRARDALADFMADMAAPPSTRPGDPQAGGVPLDPLALFGGPAPPAPPAASAGPAQADDLPGVYAAYSPPRAALPPAPPAMRPSPPRPAAGPPSAAPVPPAVAPAATAFDAAAHRDRPDLDAAWQAFCAGAGIDLPVPAGSAAQRLEALGRIMRSAIEGTLQLMAVRASTKHELRAMVTVIQPRSNNPLKFSPDAKSAIEQLLQPAARGFLDGPAAMDDAMHDLVGHSIGTVAGMRAAIGGMLDRFAPEALESKLVGGSLLDSLLPMNRKARLWELYLQQYQSIRDEAQEDFHALFGKAFLAAYEQQIERLKQGRQP
ncbi:MAG: type VI secretion system-associated FHA domain protein TagH [Rubrivivax sp.]|nr:type VI secretion system-associated FHA domain protein TagH [Rubrivivax sp.]